MEAIAATAISIIAPYLAKGAEEFAKEAGKQAFATVKALAVRLQEWWSKDPVTTAAVEALAASPERSSRTLAQYLSEDLANDAALASDLKRLLSDVGPHIEVVQRMDVARGVVGADIERLIRGSVRVNQDIKDATDVRGFTAKTVG
jgi:hypothetical protein